MDSLNKSNTKFIVLVGMIAALLLFQNCSQQFTSQCSTDCEEWRSVVAENESIAEFQKISFYDSMQFEILSKSQDLLAHYKSAVGRAPVKWKFFGEEFAVTTYIPGEPQSNVFNIHLENEYAESARMFL